VVPERIRKGVATKLGITLAEYDERQARGEWWCSGCRTWHDAEVVKASTPGYCNYSHARYRRDRSVQRYRQTQEWKDRLARVLVK
jgi:hypothetical protein